MSPPLPDSSSGSVPGGRRLLVIMRHGRAEAFAAEDHRRMLTERGALEARAAGEWLASHDLVPTYALVSSAQRAQDTWASLSGPSGTRARPEVSDAIYSAGPENALDLLRATPEDAEVVLYVGHNPTAASLAHLLDDGDPDPTSFRAMSSGFATSAMAVLEIGVPWAELDAATGRLVDFYPGHG